MKKNTLIPAFLIVLTLFSYKDYTMCPGINSSNKAIACAACHGGSISNDVVVIGGGKDEVNENDTNENENDNTDFNFEVKIPNIELSLVQIATSSVDRRINAPVSTISLTNELLNTSSISLFNTINLSSIDSGKKESSKSFNVNFKFNNAITEPQTLIIQGVLSNNDGTVYGDKTFYKEVIIQPKNNLIEEDNLDAVNLSIAHENYFYNNDKLYISSLNNKQVRIVNIQGKVVLDTQVENYEKIDVSHLNKGNYFVIIGNTGKEMQSFQFAK